MGQVVNAHLPCEDCGSSDALSQYADGSTHCFSCGKSRGKGNAQTKMRNEKVSNQLKAKMLSELEARAISQRKLKQDTCARFGYKIGELRGRTCQVAPYYHKGELIGQKLRFADKTFSWLGRSQQAELFGQHLCKGSGPRIVITEGEIDAMTVSQAFNGHVDVVSVPDGAQSAAKVIERNIEFVEGYSEVVLCFDNDKPGKEAVEKVVPILSPGKVRIVGFPDDIKDASDLMQAGRYKEIKPLIFEAQPYRPDGILSGKDITFQELTTPIQKGVPYQFPLLNHKTMGARKGELNIWTAGSGIGKSTLCRELAYDYRVNHGMRVGMVYLEENVKKTAQGFIAIDNNVPLVNLRLDSNCIPRDAYRESYDKIIKPDGLFFYKHFGSLDSKNLLSKLRYLAVACKVDYIFLDHISIVVSGNESTDERKDIDVLMTALRSLVEATGVGIHAVVHLKRTANNFNEGGQVSLRDLRGSGSLEQLSDNVMALERDQQAEGTEADVGQIRVLKCRETGDCGAADKTIYHKDTGRLLPFGDADEEGVGFQVEKTKQELKDEKEEDF